MVGLKFRESRFHSVGFTPYLSFTAEEAQKAVKGLEDNVIHTKYIELVRFM